MGEESVFSVLMQSYLLGFAAAAALGPIAVLVIQRTLRDGWRVGAISGLGVALADGVYGLVGALGLTAITSLLLDNQMILRVGGGLVLIYLGVKALFSRVEIEIQTAGTSAKPAGYLGSLTSIFLLTLSNPMTIMFFSAVYAGLAVGDGTFSADALGGAGFALFALGIWGGSFSWWLVLVSVVTAVRSRFKPAQLVWLNRASGLVIAGFGLWVLVQGVVGG